MRFIRAFLVPTLAFVALTGCKAVVLEPSGDVALRQRDLLVMSTGLMLLIIIPVMALTAWFAWHYRKGNAKASYTPEWDHSTKLELVIWAAPLLIIICLGALTWMGTHLLDPYRPLDRLAKDVPVDANVAPLDVDVVALDWKWLFIYPQYGIASLNTLAVATDRPIHFYITASSVMNSFYIPALAGQIYAMPGMETTLHAVMNKDGAYDGFSANFSGSGFSEMRFKMHSMGDADFNAWVQAAKAGNGNLDHATYLQLERPSIANPPQTYATVDPTLYHDILNICAAPGQTCMDRMMAVDMAKDKHGKAMAMTMPMADESSTQPQPMSMPGMDMHGDMQGAPHAE